MSLFQQKGCKTWRVRFSIGCRQFDLPLKTRNKEVAQERARDLIREKERELAGLLAPKIEREAAQTPLSELLKRWLENGLAPTVTCKHRALSRNRPTRVFEACGWKLVRDITPQSFEAWRNRKHRDGASAKTLNEYLAHVRSFLGWLEERQMIAINPLRIVKPLPVVREDSGRAFSFEELQALVSEVPSYRACLYTVAAFTGLRRSELRDLEWSRVVLDGSAPRIEPEASKTKNRKGQAIPLHSDALAALQQLRDSAPAGKPLVFFKGITKMERFRKDLQAARIAELDAQGRELDFHALRRTLATMLNCAGVSPRAAMELMRHSDMKLTFRTYTDARLLPLSQELQKLPSLGSSLKSSLKTGKACPKLSKPGKSDCSDTFSEDAEDAERRPDLTHPDQGCPTLENPEGVGFEPTRPFGLAVFKTAAIDHSATPPSGRSRRKAGKGEDTTPVPRQFKADLAFGARSGLSRTAMPTPAGIRNRA